MPILHVVWSQRLAQMVYGIYRASHPKHHTKLRPVGAEEALEGPMLKAAEVAPGAPFPVLVAAPAAGRAAGGLTLTLLSSLQLHRGHPCTCFLFTPDPENIV